MSFDRVLRRIIEGEGFRSMPNPLPDNDWEATSLSIMCFCCLYLWALSCTTKEKKPNNSEAGKKKSKNAKQKTTRKKRGTLTAARDFPAETDRDAFISPLCARAAGNHSADRRLSKHTHSSARRGHRRRHWSLVALKSAAQIRHQDLAEGRRV